MSSRISPTQNFVETYATVTSGDHILTHPVQPPPIPQCRRALGEWRMETIATTFALSPPSPPSSKLSSSLFLSHGLLFSSNSHRRDAAAPPLAAAPLRGKAHQSVRAAALTGRRRPLSEGWDLSGSVAGTSWLPRFEELDTTNMLLRQRIVFLGSQV